MKKILLTILTVFALSTQAFDFLPSSYNWNSGSSGDAFAATLSAAEADYASALAASMAWRDTGAMIKEAKKLHKSGKVDAATALVKKAHTQAENALAQAAVAGSAGPLF
ncbi:hypothetical protein [Candidatus Thioglobus sp.]|jgi:hypothetical protein|uniref:hypothetical protein n=1 Tax=Candidatus Thioglobus sp. TaxID=2026721 RepID=UPI0017549127|nr:hypothetical protein [Candidatus Thioglobus sp.]